ncbi:hypothetical protein Forpe1208_v016227 [Fusarium oxysporum f. sp. rapae]|uniref:Uncharacterized protein n=1 Tax=Fusarium oxysporum f. sp. rapae TaxID=485398 RepID=A0A8J5TMV7_FUSOX|nr:hypothetical protein Forpe1208_v016227 [Fusarium oxysporum f. sp. rapae]
MCLPLENMERVTGESAERLGLLSSIPSCYQYDSSSASFSLTADYENNGSKPSERYFPIVFFDGLKSPSKSSVAWVHIDLIKEWDEEEAQTIEHSQQAINYIKEGAKSQTRQYGSDDEIPDLEADDGPFSRLPSRSPSKNLQPGPDEGNQEIRLETQEEPEVRIGQEKPTSLQDSNRKADYTPSRAWSRRNPRPGSLRYRKTIHSAETHSQVDSENLQDVADVNKGRLARRPKKAYGMELYLDGDDVQEGAKLAQYTGSPIHGDDLRPLRKENDDHTSLLSCTIF